MKQVFSLICLTLMTTYSLATVPIEVKAELKIAAISKEIEGLQWNRWTTKNFVICALNDKQSQYVNEHIEEIKTWLLKRWGLLDIDFSSPCKIICVDNADLFKKFFNIDSSKAEVRRDSDGKIKETVIFLLTNDIPSRTIPMPLSEICLAEFAQKMGSKFNMWVYRGMTNLNGAIPQIKNKILEMKPLVDKDEPIYFSKGLLEMSSEQYDKLTIDKKNIYDANSTVFCLLLRKEFGQDKFLRFLKQSGDNPEKAVQEVLGFQSYSEFDKSLKRFMIDLLNDLSSGKTPETYLEIREK